MPKRSKKKKVWYPEDLFEKMRFALNVDVVEDITLEEQVEAYNMDKVTDFDPTDAVIAYHKWERRQTTNKEVNHEGLENLKSR